jgi:endoglycosylceramidase
MGRGLIAAQIFNNTVVGSGFDHVPGGAANAAHSVLSFHAYCWFFDIGDGHPSALRKGLCDQLFGMSCGGCLNP